MLDALYHGGNTLAQADAHGGDTQGHVLFLHHSEQGAGDTGTGTAKGVTQGDGAAVQTAVGVVANAALP